MFTMRAALAFMLGLYLVPTESCVSTWKNPSCPVVSTCEGEAVVYMSADKGIAQLPGCIECTDQPPKCTANNTAYLTEQLSLANSDDEPISSIELGTFANWTHIRSLRLTMNLSKPLPPKVFSKLTSLRRLNLIFVGNSNPSLPAEVFAGLGNLTWLTVTVNTKGRDLVFFSPTIFAPLGKLDTLVLNIGGQLRAFPNDFFKPLKSLNLLNVTSNAKLSEQSSTCDNETIEVCKFDSALDEVFETGTLLCVLDETQYACLKKEEIGGTSDPSRNQANSQRRRLTATLLSSALVVILMSFLL